MGMMLDTSEKQIKGFICEEFDGTDVLDQLWPDVQEYMRKM